MKKTKKALAIILSMVLMLCIFPSVASASPKVQNVKITVPAAQTYTMYMGSTKVFKAKAYPSGVSQKVYWSSTKKSVATVSSSGKVKAIGPGTATIKAKSKSNAKATATRKVIVKQRVSSVSIFGNMVEGNVLSAKVEPSDGTVKYQWYRDNVAIVGATGSKYEISALDIGKALKVKATGIGYYYGSATAVTSNISSGSDAFVSKISSDYVYEVIDNLLSQKSNEDLGFRMAGSKAEKANANYLYQEYQKIGLTNVTKDAVKVDSWEFKKANLYYTDTEGNEQKITLASYATHLMTDGRQTYDLVYAGNGRAYNYENLDVEGKIVLIDTDQYNTQWITSPAYEAMSRGAVAVIANETGYGTLNDDILAIQDVCGSEDAPALSISVNNRNTLKSLIDADADQEISIDLDVDSQIARDQTAYNIWGEIPGKSDDVIIVMAHYDSYFNAYNDDTEGTGVMLAVAKAMKESGYVPDKTIRFVSHCAEEWGFADTNYDWGIGAYRQISQVHPEWADKGYAVVNIDGFRIGSGNQVRTRSVSQLYDFIESDYAELLPEGYTLQSREATTITDDFNYQLAGIPRTGSGSSWSAFTEEVSHSSGDTKEYNEAGGQIAKTAVKVESMGQLIMAFDNTLVQPLHYEQYFKDMKATVSVNAGSSYKVKMNARSVQNRLDTVIKAAAEFDAKVDQINNDYSIAYAANDKQKIKELKAKAKELNTKMFALYKHVQDKYTRLNYSDEIVAPHELYQANVDYLINAKKILETGGATAARNAVAQIKEVDENGKARYYSRAVYDYQVAQKMGTLEPDRMAWGEGMIEEPAVDLYSVVSYLVTKYDTDPGDLTTQISAISDAIDTEEGYLNKMLIRETSDVRSTLALINGMLDL